MTDPEHMTADELEALVAKTRSASYVDRADAHATLAGAAPELARRPARLLWAVEMVLADWEDEQGWCNFCDSETFHYAECPIPVLRAAMEAGE